jgi:GSCFA family
MINKCHFVLVKQFTEDDVFKDTIADDTYHSWSHHSSYSSLSVPSMLKRMNNDITAARINLVSAKVLFITLGTSRVHVLKGTDRVVSNCHKQPSTLFEKKQLTVRETVVSLREAILACKELNPRLQVGKWNG